MCVHMLQCFACRKDDGGMRREDIFQHQDMMQSCSTCLMSNSCHGHALYVCARAMFLFLVFYGKLSCINLRAFHVSWNKSQVSSNLIGCPTFWGMDRKSMVGWFVPVISVSHTIQTNQISNHGVTPHASHDQVICVLKLEKEDLMKKSFPYELRGHCIHVPKWHG